MPVSRYHTKHEYTQLMATNPKDNDLVFDHELDLPSTPLINTNNRVSNVVLYPDVLLQSRQHGFHDCVEEYLAGWGRTYLRSPLTDIQVTLKHLQASPYYTQKRIFNSIYPMFIIVATFFALAMAVRHESDTQAMIANPSKHCRTLVIGLIVFIGSVLVGVAIVRLLVWVGAHVIDWIVCPEPNIEEELEPDGIHQVPQGAALISNMFT
ncbi:hypothetical protein QCA50_014910 [Cerrena zonata]|uniref:PRA1 family protein n=1 Tax=Cerrena zonata TaxID=2478898 RepID=A0AAW0FWH3_9APHY